MKNCNVISGSFDIFDPEEMSEVVPAAQLEHTQLTPGRFNGTWLHANLGDSTFASGIYNRSVLAKGVFPSDKITIGYVSKAEGDSTVNGQELNSHILPVWSENDEAHVMLGKNGLWNCFEIERNTLASLGIDLYDNTSQIHQLDNNAEARIKYVFNDTLTLLSQIQLRQPELVDTAKAFKTIRETLTTTLASELLALQSNQQSKATSTRHNRYRLVDKAESIFEDYGNEPVQITQLCERLHTSIRRLELAFKHVHGMSPNQFLMMRRFSLVRKELLNSSPSNHSVTEIAMQHGFFHMGRFAQRYKTMFGESPSTTLATFPTRRLVRSLSYTK